MKKIVLFTIAITLIASASLAISFREFSPDQVVYKAGPTEPHEELSIPWVEAVLFPKKVSSGKTFFVEVSLATKAKEVKAVLDQDKNTSLLSNDQRNWDLAFDSPDKLSAGLHFLELKIIGRNGKSIKRTLAFHVEGNKGINSYPVVLKDKAKLSNGTKLDAGDKVDALYRQTYVWVKTENGKEGWIEASKIETDKRGIYMDAYQAYLNKDYDRAISLYSKVLITDPDSVQANYWLAKSYDKLGNQEKTILYLKKTLALDPDHQGANWFAVKFARSYYRKGKALTGMGKNNEAIDAYKEAVALRPSSISYWMALGRTYKRTGKYDSATNAWKKVLLIDPDNRDVHALLRTDYYKLIAGEEAAFAKKESKRRRVVSKPRTNRNANRYIEVVKNSRTNKGTSIGSAIKSVLSMTRSLGTKVYEEGWKASLSNNSFFVSYACKQEKLGKFVPEIFSFKVDLDSKRIEPQNKNARLLMHRW